MAEARKQLVLQTFAAQGGEFDRTAYEQLLPGITVGRYRLVRELGRGATAVVWEAEQISLALHEVHRGGTNLHRYRLAFQVGGGLDV